MNKIKKNKNYLFIDGTNLYAGQYELCSPRKYLDFSLLITDLEVKLKIKFDKIYFYASYSPLSKKPSKKEKEYLKNEAMFYKSVKKTKNVEFFTGYRSKTSGKEKEVDVKLTADIITYAFLDRYDSVYLFTGDADFLQALFSIKKFHNKKKINIISLQNKVLFRGAFFFKTYILILNQILLSKLKFRDFQKHEFIYVSSEIIIKDV